MSLFDAMTTLVLISWLLAAGLACYGLLDCVRSLKPAPPISVRPNIALIIPVRGLPPRLPELWDAICSQRLAPARVIFALESRSDPACDAIEALPSGPRRDCVIAGPTTTRGQKV